MKFKKPQRQQKIKKLKSINAVLLRQILLLSFLLVLLVEVICFVIVKNTEENAAKERLMRVGRQATVLVHNEMINDYIRNYYRQEGINVFVLDRDGNVLLPTGDEMWAGDISVVIKKLNGLPIDAASVYSYGSTLNYATRVNFHGQETYLVASYSLSILAGARRMLILYFVIVGVAIMLLATLIVYIISQRLLTGLRTLSSTAVRFSQGDFNVNFANAEYQELADLSDTLNSVRDEVKKSGDFQRELLANVSHDLKTPLTMIKAYASMIQEISGNNPEKREKHLQVIIDESDRLTGLVNDVLSVSKLTSNIDEINFKVFNLTEFLYGIINKFSYLQETQGYSIMVDIDANLYTCADAEKIGQVIYNLLGNAVNYTGEDKTVYISLKKNLTDERIKLSIRDTGKGISKEDLPDIWDRYYRVKETHTRPVKGTGLGLHIVKIILKNHSFDFGVESEIGKGSTFWVDFPSVPAEDNSLIME